MNIFNKLNGFFYYLLFGLCWVGLSSFQKPLDNNDVVFNFRFGEEYKTLKTVSTQIPSSSIYNAKLSDGLLGERNAMRFGRDSRIICGRGTKFSVNGDMTLEMRLRLNEPANSVKSGNIFVAPNSFQLAYTNYGSSLIFYYRNIFNSLEMMAVPIDKNLLSNQWTTIGIVVEYPRIKIFKDGKIYSDIAMLFPGVSGSIQRAMVIGGNTNGTTLPMDVSSCSLFRRAFTSSEMLESYQGHNSSLTKEENLKAEPNWYKDSLYLRYTIKGGGPNKNTAYFEVKDKDGQILKKVAGIPLVDVSMNGSGRLSGLTSLPLRPLQGKEVIITSGLSNSSTRVINNLNLLPPKWVKSNVGLMEKVPSPWSPISIIKDHNQIRVKVWGREYNFGLNTLVESLITKNENLLDSPIRFNGKINGNTVEWRNSKLNLISSSDKLATISQHFESSGMKVEINSSTEYDGYTIFDCRFSATTNLKINKLNLVVPLKSEFSTLCYEDSGIPWDSKLKQSQWYSGKISHELSFPFSPNIWIGNEDIGFCWQAESSEGWNNADSRRAITITPAGAKTLVCFNFIDLETILKSGSSLHYKFAVMATPVKPLLHEAWDFRIARSEPYGRDLHLPNMKAVDGTPILQYYSKIGIKNLFVNVTDNWPWPIPKSDVFSNALHNLNNTAHNYGLKVYPYLIHMKFPVLVPEFDIYGQDIMRRPEIQNVLGTNPPGSLRTGPLAIDYGANSQSAFQYCAQSAPLQDSYIYSLKQRLELYNDDGIYLDGTGIYSGCNNISHGCGYYDSHGKLQQTFPVFAIHKFMQRIYNVVKGINPNNIIDLHSSFAYNPAALAYADVFWSGEQFGARLDRKGAKNNYIPSALSLDQFRTEFMGYQIGVGAELLTYRLGDNMRSAAISLLHDISPRINSNSLDTLIKNPEPYSALITKLWKLREDFGMKTSKKYFYWKNKDFVTINVAECYCSFFQNVDQEVLAIVSNLGTTAKTIRVKFNLTKLGMSSYKLFALDPLTNISYPINQNGEVTLPLASQQWKYLWIKKK